MATTTMDVRVNTKQIQRLVDRFPREVQNRINGIFNDGSIIVQKELKKKAPVGVTANLGRNVERTVNAQGARIVPKEKYHSVIEYGRRRGAKMPPYGDPVFKKWVAQKLGADVSPFLVARSIARKGTKAQPYIVPAYVTTKPKVQRYAASQISKMVTELNN